MGVIVHGSMDAPVPSLVSDRFMLMKVSVMPHFDVEVHVGTRSRRRFHAVLFVVEFMARPGGPTMHTSMYGE